MMKSVSDALQNIYNTLQQARSIHDNKLSCWLAIRSNISQIDSVTRYDVPISLAEQRFLGAAFLFTGGDSYTATTLRSLSEHETAYEQTISLLQSYKRALKAAVVSEEARILHTVDDTDVSDPF